LSGSTTSVFYYFSDHLKTASVITDAAGIIKADSDYYTWGGELQFVNNDSNHYKFTGKERDSETGLDRMGTNEGPDVDDYFLVFVTVEDGKLYFSNCPFYSSGRDEALSILRERFGGTHCARIARFH